MLYIPGMELVTETTTDSNITPTPTTPGLNPEMTEMEAQLKTRVSELKQICEMPNLKPAELKALEERIQNLLSEVKSLAAENPEVQEYKTMEAELQKQLSGMKVICDTVVRQDEKIKDHISDLQETMQENAKTD